jgi:hypothetical protein
MTLSLRQTFAQQLQPAFRPELYQQRAYVKLDGPFGKDQLASYFFIAKISVYTFQHLPFSFGKFFIYTNRIEKIKSPSRSLVTHRTVHFREDNQIVNLKPISGREKSQSHS